MYSVLIADDEEIIKIGLRSIIDWESYGFKIAGTAENGEQALKLIKELTPDLVITDLYMPVMDGLELIKRIKDNGLHCEIIVLSNYGDIEYVKKAMKLGAEDYLLKISYNKEKFIGLLLHMKELLDKKAQTSGTAGASYEFSNNKQEKIKDFLYGAGSQFGNMDKNYYQLFLLSLPAPLKKLEDSLYIDVMKKMEMILKENFNMYTEKYFIMLDRTHYVFVVNTWDTALPEENTMHIKMQKTLAVYLMISATIVYENNIMGMYHLRTAFLKAVEMSEVAFWKSGCFALSSVKFQSVSEVIHMPKAVNHYKRYIENPDMERLRMEIRNVLHNFEANLVHPKEVKQFIVTLFSHMRIYIYQYYGSDFVWEYDQEVGEVSSGRELNEIAAKWLDALCEFVRKMDAKQGGSAQIDRIKFYIEQNMGEKLRVNEIAEHFGFHPNYLSSYFKEQTGVTVINYINQMKMDYAKELLEQKKYRVKEVANMVGIEDPLYFNKMFRNYFGCAPTKFAAECSKKDVKI